MNDARTESMAEGYEVTSPKLALYHPNAKGTGCAIILELYPATKEHEGFILCSFANQMTVGNPMGDNQNYPKFDWENGVVVRLWFDDLTHMLQVLRGETESIHEGRGIFRKYKECSQRIQLRHVIEPVCGYSFEVFETPANRSDEKSAHMLLSPAESLGLCESIAGSMYLIAFGSPYATK